jgi:type II secretory pathway component GspD/PulD (secretin)
LEYGPDRDAVVVARKIVALGALALVTLTGVAPAQDKEKEKKVAPPVAPTSAPKSSAKPAMTPSAPTSKVGAPTPVTSPSGAPMASPTSAGAVERAPLPDIESDDPNMITLAAFSGPVDLTALIELLARTLDINVTLVGEVTGQVVFNAPKAIPKDRFLPFVDALLNQQNYTITYDPESQFFVVQQVSAVTSELEGERATTRIISTPNVRPSSLQTALGGQLGGGAAPGQGGARQLSYVDELGIIIATDTVRKLDQLEALVSRILAEYAKTSWIRIELDHVAAPVARERALQLVGLSSGTLRGFGDPNQPQQVQVQPGGRGQSLDNMGDRLTVDAQGNALIFRGFPEEIQQVQTVLAIIDKPSQLQPKRYNVGGAARQVADIARQRGLGEVTTIQSESQDGQFNQLQFQNPQFQSQAGRQGQTLSGGSVMVVDESRGAILYYGTADQQAQMERLVDELDIQSESLVIRAYKLVNSDAEKMADLINGLIRNETPAASNPLLGDGGTGTFSGANPFGPRVRKNQQRNPNTQEQANPNDLSITGDAFVIANKALNQVLIKAPAKQQPEFAKLIEKLDLRRPQVYVEAKIVVVNWTDDLRLAFETQLINAGGKGGVLNTNFGLSSFGTGGAITTAKTVSTALGGFTGALINSDYVPIIMTALQREVDGRILATPQLLMDDNEESKLVSVDQQPTTVTTLTTGNNQVPTTSFGNYVDAGTELTITPQISDGGYLRMKYHIKLSSFTGTGTNGVPPPRQENTLDSESVTVPSDMTIILGGLTLDQKGRTQVKIPLIGDIPILGQLFKDDNRNDRKTTLYVFLTPRIMRDPNFLDLRLKTRGPRSNAMLADDFPPLTPTMIDGADRRPILPMEEGKEGEATTGTTAPTVTPEREPPQRKDR